MSLCRDRFFQPSEHSEASLESNETENIPSGHNLGMAMAIPAIRRPEMSTDNLPDEPMKQLAEIPSDQLIEEPDKQVSA